MDGANRQFMNGKEKWLANNLMIYGVERWSKAGEALHTTTLTKGTVGTELSVLRFDLRKQGNIINSGKSAKQYLLCGLDDTVDRGNKKMDHRVIGKRTTTLSAYFLPWDTGATYSGRLGEAADFFFTPTLNGCTFAYRGAGTNPEVAHSNYVDDNQSVDQTKMDADILKVFGTMPPNIIRKSDYKQAIPDGSNIVDYRTMIIGIRSGNGWRFYRQGYSVHSSPGVSYNSGTGLCQAI